MHVDRSTRVHAQLLALWREVLERDDLTEHDDPLELGATSIQLMAVIGRVGDELSIDAPIDEILDARSIGAQAEALLAACP